MTYDVIVVGAGPSGSTVSRELGLRGHRVLLLDKDRFPREKACGDGLTPRAVAALREIGLENRFKSAKKILGLRLIEHLGGSESLHRFDRDNEVDHALVVPRIEFDQVLVDAAREAGAEFWPETLVEKILCDDRGRAQGVKVRHSDGTLDVESRFVVIAEGSAGRFGAGLRSSSLGLADRCFAVRQYCRGGSSVGPYYDAHFPITDGTRSVPGYGWIFPVSDDGDVVNVGAVVGYGRGFDQKVSVRHLYARFLDMVRNTDRLKDLEPFSPLIGSSLRQGLVPEECVGDGILSVGDAASLVNPFTGEGISYALESGVLAASVLHRSILSGTDDLSNYPVLLRNQFRRLANLRQDIPDLIGMFRVYDWIHPKRQHDHSYGNGSGGVLASNMRRLLKDDARVCEGILRPLLWNGLDGTELRADLVEVDRRVVEEVSSISRTFGEVTHYTREGLLFLPGYLATLVLLAARSSGMPRATAVEIAITAELVELSLLFHADVGSPVPRFEEDACAGSWSNQRAHAAAGILIGDSIIATTFRRLNEFRPEISRTLSDAVVRYLGKWLERAVAYQAWSTGDQKLADPISPLSSFASELVSLVFGADAESSSTGTALVSCAKDLSKGAQILQEVLLDLRGSRDTRRLYLLRCGFAGRHVHEAVMRGVRFEALCQRARTPEDFERNLIATQRAMVDRGSVGVACEAAAHAVEFALASLDGIADAAEIADMRRLATNLQRAIKDCDPELRELSRVARSNPEFAFGFRM